MKKYLFLALLIYSNAQAIPILEDIGITINTQSLKSYAKHICGFSLSSIFTILALKEYDKRDNSPFCIAKTIFWSANACYISGKTFKSMLK